LLCANNEEHVPETLREVPPQDDVTYGRNKTQFGYFLLIMPGRNEGRGWARTAPVVEPGSSDFILPSDTPRLLQSLLRFFPAVFLSLDQAIGILLGRIARNLVNEAQWANASLFTRFLDHTQLHTTLSRTPLDK
jgi:hypothetical protein